MRYKTKGFIMAGNFFQQGTIVDCKVRYADGDKGVMFGVAEFGALIPVADLFREPAKRNQHPKKVIDEFIQNNPTGTDVEALVIRHDHRGLKLSIRELLKRQKDEQEAAERKTKAAKESAVRPVVEQVAPAKAPLSQEEIERRKAQAEENHKRSSAIHANAAFTKGYKVAIIAMKGIRHITGLSCGKFSRPIDFTVDGIKFWLYAWVEDGILVSEVGNLQQDDSASVAELPLCPVAMDESFLREKKIRNSTSPEKFVKNAIKLILKNKIYLSVKDAVELGSGDKVADAGNDNFVQEVKISDLLSARQNSMTQMVVLTEQGSNRRGGR